VSFDAPYYLRLIFGGDDPCVVWHLMNITRGGTRTPALLFHRKDLTVTFTCSQWEKPAALAPDRIGRSVQNRMEKRNQQSKDRDRSSCTEVAHGKAETGIALLPSRAQVASRIRLISYRRSHFLSLPPRRRTWRRLATAVG
jgi:hypothetical protein